MRAEQTPAQLAKKFPLDKFGTEVADKLLTERRRELLAACRQLEQFDPTADKFPESLGLRLAHWRRRQI